MWEVYSELLGVIGYVTGHSEAAAFRAAQARWPGLWPITVERVHD